MTEKALFLKLLAYNEQTTDRILDGAKKLTAEQISAPPAKPRQPAGIVDPYPAY